MTDLADFRSHIISLENDPEFRREAAQVQAKALLTDVTKVPPSYNWKYIPHRILRNLVVTTFELETIARTAPDLLQEVASATRRFALIWESLARLQEGTSKDLALANAAINYELAGYQANAMCIARRMEREREESDTISLSYLFGLFLQRKFFQLIGKCGQAQREPDADLSKTELVEVMSIGLASKGFTSAVKFFRGGNFADFEEAQKIFTRAYQLFASLALVEESNLSQAILSLLPVMKRRSTWALLRPQSPDSFKWERYLKLLARGVGTSLLSAQSICELWPSQIKALEKGLLATTANKLVKMPTSAGKTRIAELAIIHTLVNNPGARCVYVAPYRALATEVEAAFFNLLSDLGYKVSSVTGAYESDEFEDLLLQQTDVLVCTPEKLDLLLREQPEYLAAVRLVVLDEGHIIHDSVRGIKIELLLTRLKRRLAQARFIILSAVVPQETLTDFAKWFNASPQEDVLDSVWRPSVQRIAKFEWNADVGVLRYSSEEDVPLLKEFVPGVIRKQTFAYENPKTGRINRPSFPDKSSKAQTAAELAYKFADLGPVLVFCPQPAFVSAVAKALHQRIEYARLQDAPLPKHFAGGGTTRSSILADEWLSGRPISEWLKCGIGVHYGNLPDDIREAVETDFRQRKLRVIIATNTLAQGVNLPVKTVIIHSCRRWVSENRRERISARDYWNIAGRAGRAGEETEGLVIHISNDRLDDLDFEYYLARKGEVEPVESALFQHVKDLAGDRLSEEGLKASLDPEILALLVEEASDKFSIDDVTNLLDSSLVKVQADRKGQSLEKLNQAFLEVAQKITTNIPDPELRAVYSYTGLSSNSCEVIRQHIEANEEQVKDLLQHATIESTDEIADLLLPLCLSLPETRTTMEFAGDYGELFKRWLEGADFKEIVFSFEHQADSAEELGKFIDDAFRYRLPWGIRSYLRIAQKITEMKTEASQIAEISEVMKFFPAMVKYGLPDPVACWARSIGIPFRRTAIQLSTRFKENFDTYNYDMFLAWLGALTFEQLQSDFGLSRPYLEDLYKTISRADINLALREINSFNTFLPINVEVQGIKYEGREVTALRARVNAIVTLERDYDLVYDRNAIAISLFNQPLGYVPRKVAQILAPEMDIGTYYQGQIIEVQRTGAVPRVFIKIYTSH